jgi:mannose-1-phosphate guanylyltransferase
VKRSAILLVGGMGTRLHPLTLSTPKPMLPVAGVPFTEHQIVKAREAGITEIVLATAFKAEIFKPHFGDGSNFGIEIKYAVEESALGTGGAIRNAASALSGDGLVAIFNGDVLTGHDLDAQFNFHQKNDAEVSLYLTEVADARAFGAVELDKENRVLAFNEKMENPPTNIINAGCYIFNRKVIDEIPAEKIVSVERETFPGLLKRGAKVFGFVDTSYWLDIGTPSALLKASKDLLCGAINSAATPAHNGDVLILDGGEVDSSAKIANGSVVGAGAVVEAGAELDGSILFDGAVVGPGSKLKNCFVAPNFKVPANIHAEGNYFGF